MRTIIIIFISLINLSVVNAQMTADSKRVADVYFLNKEYYAAAEYYKKALQISADSTGFVVPHGFEKKIQEESPKKNDYEYAVYQLATSLRLYRNFQDAEKWYAIATSFTNAKYAQSEFWYATCLRANFRFDEAILAFSNFAKRYTLNDGYKELAKFEIESCKFALAEIKYPRLFKLDRLSANINEKGSNYAPILIEDDFYFTSSRPTGGSGKSEILTSTASNNKVVKKETPYINAIYVADNAENATSVSKVNVNLKQMELAATSFHPNGNTMYFTAWINKDERTKSIYLSKKIGENKWTDPVVLGGEINVNGFNSIQPSVTKDGKYLIFSSDRPGGSGKYDLWYAIIRADGTTGNAVNMGEKINTKGDEQAAYYNPKTQRLLFSSNGRVGMGGYDFFETTGDFADWQVPINLGYPFNSAKDDMYFTSLDDLDTEGYISSDRESLCCLEIFKVKRETLFINGKLIDCKTQKPLEGATVTLTGNDMRTQTTQTNADGLYNFGINSNRGFKLNAVKDLYFAKNLTYGYEKLASVDTLKSDELCLVPFIVDKPIVLENILYEFNSAELTPSSQATLDYLYNLMVDNKNIEIELGAHTDNIGKADYNMDLSHRRAKSCVDYLINKGINPGRLASKGYGLTMPIAANQLKNGVDNPEGRALNRRTEFKVTKK
ncbi:OmpA family protein [Pedobacter namyangjuensis]|uniref:OmpA family protein n=1 Tax=Pedobacter namyangjuensis TaxID=600626 RepID=UPI000DE406B1|nr:OmpA family protein [Pedobacter namyangjuensis]